MTLLISVTQADETWVVSSPALERALICRRASEAEGAARALAEASARKGVAAEVAIFLKNGMLAGRFRHPPFARGRPTLAFA